MPLVWYYYGISIAKGGPEKIIPEAQGNGCGVKLVLHKVENLLTI